MIYRLSTPNCINTPKAVSSRVIVNLCSVWTARVSRRRRSNRIWRWTRSTTNSTRLPIWVCCAVAQGRLVADTLFGGHALRRAELPSSLARTLDFNRLSRFHRKFECLIMFRSKRRPVICWRWSEQIVSRRLLRTSSLESTRSCFVVSSFGLWANSS